MTDRVVWLAIAGTTHASTTERLIWLAWAVWFGVLSRAAFHQLGIVAQGPIIRLLQRGPIPWIVFLSSLDVDREAYGKHSEGTWRVVDWILGIMFAAVSVVGLFLSITGG